MRNISILVGLFSLSILNILVSKGSNAAYSCTNFHVSSPNNLPTQNVYIEVKKLIIITGYEAQLKFTNIQRQTLISRFVVGQHVTLQDDVVSHLNISRVTEQDGGEYACVAANSAGKALHAARVNVYGLPYIREMPKVTAVAGSDLNIKCPVAGYPIESITWERGKLSLTYSLLV